MSTLTSRRLIVLRHAKSDQYSDAPTDHDRPLNARGIRNAPLIGARLAELGWVPQVVVSSDALRTRQTWEHMHDALGGTPQVSFARALYLAGPTEVREALRGLPDEVGTAMVIGHNPGWEDVVFGLSGVRVRMTTANAALLEVQAAGWAEAVGRGDWRLDAVLRPKEL
ncbi:MAG: histidine phosphatase family protein [Nannocystaceae bacterium]